jgi:hypothetical protein
MSAEAAEELLRLPWVAGQRPAAPDPAPAPGGAALDHAQIR